MKSKDIDKEMIMFDLYKQLKGNIKHPNENCKDSMTEHSFYCLNCKQSTCPFCSFEVHHQHQMLRKTDFFQDDTKLISDHFQDIENIFNLNPEYINTKKLRGEMKIMVDKEMKAMQQTLESIRKQKMAEIDALFDTGEPTIEALKKKVLGTKNQMNSFFAAQNNFFGFDNEKPNEDYCNSAFLLKYDLLYQTQEKNQEIKEIFSELKDSCARYSDDFTSKMQEVRHTLDSLTGSISGAIGKDGKKSPLPYQKLKTDFYQEITDKINKYTQMIQMMKRSVYESVSKKGHYDEIEKLNNLYEGKNKQNIENVLNSCAFDNNYTTLTLNYDSNTNEINNNGSGKKEKEKDKEKDKENKEQQINNNLIPEKKERSIITIQSEDHVTLSNPLLQKYFTYLVFEVIQNNFHKGKPEDVLEFDYNDDEIDTAKPIHGTNEIQIYDRKTRILTKKKVHLDKTKHKFNYFLTGSRWVLIKDILYITGGVDMESNESNICLSYNMKSNEAYLEKDMFDCHAYHSMYYIDNYKTLFVIGGEQNPKCELFDFYKREWKELPDLNCPRGQCCLYFDRPRCTLYTIFGISDTIIHSTLYSEVIEKLDIKRTNKGWLKVDYNNKAELDFKHSYCQVFPVDYDRVLIYGASGGRDKGKKAGVFVLPKKEIVKIDNKLFTELRIQAKKSSKLSKIMSTIIK